MIGCTDCRDGLDHCHGTLLILTEYEVRCSQPDCTDLRIERHELVLWPEHG